MLNIIQDFVKSILPSKKKTTPSGWTSFNAPCCIHHGETQDTRSRGGVMSNPNGSLSYHCFNCQFKASYVPGRHLTYKFRKLLSWLGATEIEIKRRSAIGGAEQAEIGGDQDYILWSAGIDFQITDAARGS